MRADHRRGHHLSGPRARTIVHPKEEEVIYVISGEGEQTVGDGEPPFPIREGDAVYIPAATLHSTYNTTWRPVAAAGRHLHPGGAETALDALPDARILEPGLAPQWTEDRSRSRPMAASPRIMPGLNGLQEARDSSPTSSTSQRRNWRDIIGKPSRLVQQRGTAARGHHYFPVSRIGLSSTLCWLFLRWGPTIQLRETMSKRRRRLDPVEPFGDPDGSRADLEDVISEFVDFAGDPAFGHLATRANDSMVRVIVGARAGKTVYLRRLQDFQSRQRLRLRRSTPAELAEDRSCGEGVPSGSRTVSWSRSGCRSGTARSCARWPRACCAVPSSRQQLRARAGQGDRAVVRAALLRRLPPAPVDL